MARERKRLAGYDDYDDGTLRKPRKKGGFLKKFIIALGVIVVLFAVIIVAGLFIGDGLLKSNFGISLFDMFGAFGDLGHYDRDKIVTNGYGDDDVNGFYTAANDMLYFKSGDGEAVINSEYVKELASEAGSNDVDSVMASLLGILSSENFDSDKLGAYTGWKADTDHASMLTAVTDRQFAAFFNDLVFDSGMIGGMGLGDLLGGGDISEMLGLEQIIIEKNEPEAVLLAGEPGSEDADTDVYMTMTVRVDLHKTLDSLATKPENGLLASLGWLIKIFLPKETYLSVTVDMSDASKGMSLEINSLSDETCSMTAKEEILGKYDTDGDGVITRMERILVIIESFSQQDINSLINENSGEFLGYLCRSEGNEGFCFADAIDLDSVVRTESGNSFKIDMFGMLADVLNSRTGADAKAEDIIVLMQALVCSDSGAAYAGDVAHRSDLYYDPTAADVRQALATCGFSSLSDVNTVEKYERFAAAYGAISYRVTGATLGDGYVNIYGDEFMSALEKTYCLDLNKYDASGSPTGERYSFSEVAALFGISGDGVADLKLTELFDGAKLAEAAKPGEDPEKLEVTDRMLGAILTELMPDVIDESFASYDIRLRTLKISAEQVGDATHSIVTVMITLDFGGMIEGDIAEMLGGVIPDEVAVGLSVDMTPGITKEERLPAILSNYNNISSAGDASVLNGLTSGELLDALKRILPSVDIEGMVSSVSDGLGDVADNMFETLPGFRFVPSTDDSYGYAELPDIFDLAVDFLELDTGDYAISAEELRGVIDYIVNFDGNPPAVDADVTPFLKQIQQNYYIANRTGGAAAALTSFDDLFETLNGEFSTSLLRLGKAETYEYPDGAERFMGMLYDNRGADELGVELSESALLGIMLDKLSGSGFESVNKFARLIGTDVTADGITIGIEIIMSEMMSEEYIRMMGCDSVYAELAIRLKGEGAVVNNEYYATSIKINGEGESGSNYAVLMKLLRHFGAEAFDLDSIALDVGKAAYQSLSQLDTAGINYTLDASGGKIVFPSFYEYMADMLGVDGAVYTAEDMKAAVQGINARINGAEAGDYYIDGTNSYNYSSAEIVLNPLAASWSYPGDVTVVGSDVAMTDSKFGRFVTDVGVVPIALGSPEQFVGIPSGADKGNAAAVQAMLERFAPGKFVDGDYVVFTFLTDMSELFSASNPDAELSGLLPDNAYMTLVFSYNKGAAQPLTFEDFIINGMTERVRDLLIGEICGVDIAGLIGGGGQIAAHANDASSLISDYDFSISVYNGDGGCGTITLPADQVTGKLSIT